MAELKLPMKTSFSGVAPMRTPVMIPSNGGFSSSLPMRPIVARVVKKASRSASFSPSLLNPATATGPAINKIQPSTTPASNQ